MSSKTKIYSPCESIGEAIELLSTSAFPNIKAFGKNGNEHFIEKVLAYFREFRGRPYDTEQFHKHFEDFLAVYLNGIGFAAYFFTKNNDTLTLAMCAHDIVTKNIDM